MAENSTKPKIRFKGFSGDWEPLEFRDLGSVAMNKRIFKDQTSEAGDVPFYKIGTFGGKPDAFISRQLFEEYKTKFSYPRIGDILLSASGSIGRVVEYTGADEYFQDSNIVWLEHDERLDNLFLKHFYSIVKWQGLEGSTIKRLYNKNILDTEINLPSIDEQLKIGDFFKDIDNLINLQQSKFDKLVNIKKAMLEKMFPKNGSKVPEIRFKGFTEDWEEHELDREVDFYSGLTYSPCDVIESGGTFVLRSSNVKNGEIVSADNVYVNSNVVNSANVKKGDVIVVVRNGSRSLIGKHAQIKEEMDNTVIGAFMTGIRSEQSSFINALLDTPQFDKEVEKNLGATINQITTGAFKRMKFMFPRDEERIVIGNYFKQLDNLIKLHKHKYDKLVNIKKAMLEKMFV